MNGHRARVERLPRMEEAPRVDDQRTVLRTRWLTRLEGRWHWRAKVIVREQFMADESGWSSGHWVPVAHGTVTEKSSQRAEAEPELSSRPASVAVVL